MLNRYWYKLLNKIIRIALTVKTGNPANLLAAIKKAIADEKIETWSFDKQGDFVHTPPQWKGKGWLRPSTSTTGELNLEFLFPINTVKERIVPAVYQGRFIEMLINHFNNQFTSVTSTVA